MEKLIGIFILIVLLGCNKTENPVSSNPADSNEVSQNYVPVILTLSDAKKILGESAHIADSTLSIKEDVTQYLLTFTADQPDAQTGKTGNLYYMFEKYNQVTSAQQSYTSIKKSNENHQGVQVLQDVGDETYFHSDGQNFYFILIRKGSMMVRMKVNKITSKTSQDEFNSVARRIASALPG